MSAARITVDGIGRTHFPARTVISPNSGGFSAIVLRGSVSDANAAPRPVFSPDASGEWYARVEGLRLEFNIPRVTIAGPSSSLFPLIGQRAPAGFMVASFADGYSRHMSGSGAIGIGTGLSYRVDYPDDSAAYDSPNAWLQRIMREDHREEALDAVADQEVRDAAGRFVPEQDTADTDYDAIWDRVYDAAFGETISATAADMFDAVDVADAVTAAVDAVRGEVGR